MRPGAGRAHATRSSRSSWCTSPCTSDGPSGVASTTCSCRSRVTPGSSRHERRSGGSRRVRRPGEPGRPDGPPDRRRRVQHDVVGPTGRVARALRGHDRVGGRLPGGAGRRVRHPRCLRGRRRRRRRGPAGAEVRSRRCAMGRSWSCTARCTPTTCVRLQADFPNLHVLDAPVSGGWHPSGDRPAPGHGRRPGGDPGALPTRAGHLRRPDPAPRPTGGGAGGEAPQQRRLRRPPGAGHRGLRRREGRRASTAPPSPRSSPTRSGRSYAAEIVSGFDFDVAGLAPFAGELLAKDVGILVDRARARGHGAAGGRGPGARSDGRQARGVDRSA